MVFAGATAPPLPACEAENPKNRRFLGFNGVAPIDGEANFAIRTTKNKFFGPVLLLLHFLSAFFISMIKKHWRAPQLRWRRGGGVCRRIVVPYTTDTQILSLRNK